MEENKKGFKLSKINWILVLVVIGISAFVFLRRDGINGLSFGYIFGSIVTAGVIPLFFAFITWLIKRREEFAGTHTFNIVLALMCFGMIKEIGAISKEKTDTLAMMSRSISEYKNKINNEDATISAYQDYSNNIDEGLTKMVRNSTGNEQEVYKNLQKFKLINDSVMINWQKSFDSVMEPRILDYSVLNNKTEFKYQIEVLKQYQKQSELYESHFEKRKPLLESLNKNIPEDNLTLKGLMKGVNDKYSIQKPIFESFINSHIDYSNNLIEIVEFLQNNEGKWDYKNEELIFTSIELEEKYLSLINKIIEDENQINKLTDELIEVM